MLKRFCTAESTGTGLSGRKGAGYRRRRGLKTKMRGFKRLKKYGMAGQEKIEVCAAGSVTGPSHYRFTPNSNLGGFRLTQTDMQLA